MIFIYIQTCAYTFGYEQYNMNQYAFTYFELYYYGDDDDKKYIIVNIYKNIIMYMYKYMYSDI